MVQNKIEGIILAGGKSSRMGKNKAILPYKGKRLIEQIINNLQPICSKVHVVTSKRNHHEFNFLPHEMMTTDTYDDKGPISGIHAGLKKISSNYGFLMACDMPCFSPQLFDHLKKYVQGHDAVLCPGQPFHGFYHKRIISTLETCILNNELKLLNLLDRINVYYLKPENEDCFMNVNTPEDYQNLN